MLPGGISEEQLAIFHISLDNERIYRRLDRLIEQKVRHLQGGRNMGDRWVARIHEGSVELMDGIEACSGGMCDTSARSGVDATAQH